ncbi:hypothetical protein A2U01_0005445, partial [Trifolium medium]|nr:hypothetical protein [Trifolium medium]
REPPQKRAREEHSTIDLTILDKPFLLPTCFNARGFFEKYPPMVADAERSTILTMEPAARETHLVRDTAAVMRFLETTLVLNDEKGSSVRELGKLRAKNEKLKAKLLKAEIELTDHQEKYKVFVQQTTELRETRAELEKVREELQELEASSAEEKRKLAEEVDALKSNMAHDVLEGSKYSFENVVAQLKIVNPGVELITEGIGMLRRVENGQIIIPEIIIPEVYRNMEVEEEEEDDEQLEDDNHEEFHGEDGKHQDESNDNNA